MNRIVQFFGPWWQSPQLAAALPANRRRARSATIRASEAETVNGTHLPRRGLLWIDAVGGYLVCFDDRVTLGQPTAGEAVAVPIRADLSRRHAAIRREAGAYILEPIQRVSVDGRAVDGPLVLADQQLIDLGGNVRLRFSRPHALSATARLMLESYHKTEPTADAVLLLADSLVLGPHRHCHVECRNWAHDVVLYRQGDRLYCRSDRPMTIDGVRAAAAVALHSGARVEGEEFAFTWEEMS
jgi:hypothetical protein